MPRFASERIGDEAARFSIDAYEKEIGDYMRRQVAPEVKAGLEAQVENFSRRPKFQVRVTVGRNPTIPGGYGIAVDAWPTGRWVDLWRLLNEGAEQHMIPKKPKQDGALYYRGDYDAKTKIVGDSLVVGGSGIAKGDLRSAKQVTHPGFEPRRFVYYLMEEYRPRWNAHIDYVLNQAMSAARRAR